MDPVDIFPYKQPQMRKVFRAFRQMLVDASMKHGTPYIGLSTPSRNVLFPAR
jgi:hypothetical protein